MESGPACIRLFESKLKIAQSISALDTISKEAVSGIQITSKAEDVCLSLKQVNSMNLQEAVVLDNRQFVETLFARANKEVSSKEHLVEIVTIAYKGFREEIEKSIAKAEEEAIQLIQSGGARSQSAASPSDVFIENAAKGEITRDAIEKLVAEWALSPEPKLAVKHEDIDRNFANLRKNIHENLRVLVNNLKDFSLLQMEKTLKVPPVPMKHLKQSSSICIGSGGLNRQLSQYSMLSRNGNLTIFETDKNLTVRNTGFIDFEIPNAQCSLASNNEGSLLVVTEMETKRIHCFDGKTLKKCQEWICDQYPSKALFISHWQFVVGFCKGDIRLYERGSPKASRIFNPFASVVWEMVKYSPKEQLNFANIQTLISTSICQVNDVICGDGGGRVYRVGLQSDPPEVIWKTQNHKRFVDALCLTPCRQYVATGGEDKLVYLLNATNGELLGSLHKNSSALNGCIRGLSFSKCQKYLAALTLEEIVLFSFDADAKSMKKSNKIKKSLFANEDLNSLDVAWTDGFALVGDEAGNVFKVGIDQEVN